MAVGNIEQVEWEKLAQIALAAAWSVTALGAIRGTSLFEAMEVPEGGDVLRRAGERPSGGLPGEGVRADELLRSSVGGSRRGRVRRHHAGDAVSAVVRITVRVVYALSAFG